jgi:hypothetical protein
MCSLLTKAAIVQLHGTGASETEPIQHLKSSAHKYSKAGKYTVSLTVKNAKGSNTKTISEYIIVSKQYNKLMNQLRKHSKLTN